MCFLVNTSKVATVFQEKKPQTSKTVKPEIAAVLKSRQHIVFNFLDVFIILKKSSLKNDI